jgi:hypothetical protein
MDADPQGTGVLKRVHEFRIDGLLTVGSSTPTLIGFNHAYNRRRK